MEIQHVCCFKLSTFQYISPIPTEILTSWTQNHSKMCFKHLNNLPHWYMFPCPHDFPYVFPYMFSIVHIPQALPHRIYRIRGSRLSCGTSAQTTQRSSTKLAMSRQALGRDLPGTRRNRGPRTAETGNSKPEIQELELELWNFYSQWVL